MNWRKAGFTQAKPKVPGVYFVRIDGQLLPMAPKKRQVERWDVADVMFYAGSFTNPSDNREDVAHWLISTLGGESYRWRQGMWLKGPIEP